MMTAELSIHFDGVNEQALKKYGIEIHNEKTALYDTDESDTEKHFIEEKRVMVVCERAFKQGHMFHTEAFATTIDGEFRGYRVQLPGRKRMWAVLQGEEPSSHNQIAYITVGFLDTEGNPSPDLRCILIMHPKEMARLKIVPDVPSAIPSVHDGVSKPAKPARGPPSRAPRKSMPGRIMNPVTIDSTDDEDSDSEAASKDKSNKARNGDKPVSQSPGRQTRSAGTKRRMRSSFPNYAGQNKRPRASMPSPSRSPQYSDGARASKGTLAGDASIASNAQAINEGKKEIEALEEKVREKQAMELAKQQQKKAELERLLASYK